jgi:hypothetical protein
VVNAKTGNLSGLKTICIFKCLGLDFRHGNTKILFLTKLFFPFAYILDRRDLHWGGRGGDNIVHWRDQNRGWGDKSHPPVYGIKSSPGIKRHEYKNKEDIIAMK